MTFDLVADHVIDREGNIWRVVRDGGMVTRADSGGAETIGIRVAEQTLGPLRPVYLERAQGATLVARLAEAMGGFALDGVDADTREAWEENARAALLVLAAWLEEWGAEAQRSYEAVEVSHALSPVQCNTYAEAKRFASELRRSADARA